MNQKFLSRKKKKKKRSSFIYDRGCRSLATRILVALLLCALFFDSFIISNRISSKTADVSDLPDVIDTKRQDIPIEKKGVSSHHCLNDDFHPQNSVGVLTSLFSDNMAYVKSAAKIGKAVRQKTKTPVDLVAMELKSKPLSEKEWELLRASGFIRCSVESIKAPEKTRKDLTEKFAQLHVWAMEVYETVVFLDADTFPQNSIDDLIKMDLKGKALGVTKDIQEQKWVETFNSGVMVLHPNLKEHERLVKLLYSGLKFDFIMSDQGFLNEVYKGDWHEIGFVNNANIALYRFQRKFWDQHKLEDINVIHYTIKKPWGCNSESLVRPLCEIWQAAI